MAMNTKLYTLVDALTEEYYQIWEDICNIESPSSFKEGVDASSAVYGSAGCSSLG